MAKVRISKTQTIYDQLKGRRAHLEEKIAPLASELASINAALESMAPMFASEVAEQNAQAAGSTLGDRLTAADLKKHTPGEDERALLAEA